MRKVKSIALSAAALTAIGGLGVVGTTVASAQTDSNSGNTSLVDKLASKFNLNKADVQKVFDEDRSQHEAEREAKDKARLDQAVKDGKLTQEQEDKIIAKQKELKSERDTNRDAMKDKTDAERKATMDAKKAELEKWAKDNNVPIEYLGPGGGHGPRGHGPGGM